MPRIAMMLAAVLDAVVSGVSLLSGEEGVSLLAGTVLSAMSLSCMTMLRIVGDALTLPDVMRLE